MTIFIDLPFDYIFTYTLFVKKFLDYQGLITMPFIKGLSIHLDTDENLHIYVFAFFFSFSFLTSASYTIHGI